MGEGERLEKGGSAAACCEVAGGQARIASRPSSDMDRRPGGRLGRCGHAQTARSRCPDEEKQGFVWQACTVSRGLI